MNYLQPILTAFSIAILFSLLPRNERREIRTPAFLAICNLILLIGSHLPSSEGYVKFCTHGATAFLIACLCRVLFTGCELFLRNAMKFAYPKIYLDMAMGGVYTAIIVWTLSMAGIQAPDLLTGSAIFAGFLTVAQKDVLGNLASGLIIQLQRPFEVGDWIQFNDKREHIGEVREIGWRATTVVTLDAVIIVIPNSKLAELPLTNYSRPANTPRRSIYFTSPYIVPPCQIEQIVLSAIRGSAGVCDKPAPTLVTNAFTERGIEYWLRFHTFDFSHRDGVDSGVRNRIWYSLTRNGIPFSTAQVEVGLRELPVNLLGQDDVAAAERFDDLRKVELFDGMQAVELKTLAAGSVTRRYFAGEDIIRQGDKGAELFVLRTGEVNVFVRYQSVGESLLRTLGSGDVFGEMSLLVGAPRAATVRATSDCELIVVGKGALSEVLKQVPELVEAIARIAEQRQAEIDDTQAKSASPTLNQTSKSLLQRMREYFGM